MNDKTAIDLGDIVEQLKPYIPNLIKTIGEAGSATTDDKGKVIPGDVKAASIALDLVVKHLTGQGSERVKSLLEGLKAARANDNGAESVNRANNSDS